MGKGVSGGGLGLGTQLKFNSQRTSWQSGKKVFALRPAQYHVLVYGSFGIN